VLTIMLGDDYGCWAARRKVIGYKSVGRHLTFMRHEDTRFARVKGGRF